MNLPKSVQKPPICVGMNGINLPKPMQKPPCVWQLDKEWHLRGGVELGGKQGLQAAIIKSF